MRIFLIFIFILGLLYITWPGPSSIKDIAGLPNSIKSTEPGDTQQHPNNAAYFSDYHRKDVTAFYRDQFSYLKIFGFKIPALRLNHPPEEAYMYVRDQVPSTYLEQYTYPFRDALYVNGFEPFSEAGKQYRLGATTIHVDGKYYFSKTSISYHGSSVIVRVFVYLLTWGCAIIFLKLTKKALKDK